MSDKKLTYREEYYREAIGQSLCEMDAYKQLTNEQMEQLARDIVVAIEFSSMAFGEPSSFVGKREDPEVTELKKQLAASKKETAQMEMFYKQNVSARRGWAVEDIHINRDGVAEYY